MTKNHIPDSAAGADGLPPGYDWSSFRLVAIDLDGTLADASGRVNHEGFQALQAAERAGLHPVIVTGRALPAAMGVWLRAGLSRPVIACGGALVSLPAAGRALWQRPLDATTVRRALELAYRYDLVPFLYGADAIVTDRRGPLRDLMARLNEMPVPVLGDDISRQPLAPGPHQGAGDAGIVAARPESGPPAGARERLAAWRQGQVLKVVLGGPPATIDRVQSELRAGMAGFPATCVRTLPELIEVIRPDATKDAALADLCRAWGIAPEQVIAIGDSENDLGMIRWAGLGVAVANARPEVRQAADWVIGHHAEGAVARFLRAVVAARQGRQPSI